MKQHYDIYVDERYIETLYTGWPISRLMNQLRRKYPDAVAIEIRRRTEEGSLYFFKGLMSSGA